MKLLSDGIHHCAECNIFPCSLSDEVLGDSVCKSCPIPSRCCQMPFLVLLPCEEEKLEHENGLIKFTKEGWCVYYKNGCTIHDKRPIACRIASCSWIRAGKVPEAAIEQIKNLRKEYNL